jgi:TP901 family phage tail tape measure protein
MAAKPLPLSVVLGAVDKFSGPMSKVATKLDAFASKAGKIGKALSIGITAPTAAFLGLAVKAGAEFERSMAQIAAASGKPRSELEAIAKVAQKLGETPPFSAAKLAGAAAGLAREGKTLAEIEALLPNVAHLAAANALELDQAVEIVTDSLDAFNLEARESTQVVDKLSVAAQKSGGLQNLVASLDGVAPAAAAVGASLDDTLTVLVALNATGSEGTKGAAALRTAYTKLAEAGVDAKLHPLAEILGDLKDKGADAGKFIELFGSKAGPALAAAAAQGSGGLRKLRQDLDASGGEASRRAALATEGAGFAFERLAASVEKLQLAIAKSGILDFVAKLVDAFSGWISSVAESNPELLQLVTVLALVAATLGPLILIAGQIAGAISAISTVLTIATPLVAAFNAVLAANPIGLVVLAVVALIGAIYLLWKHWDKVFGFLRATWELFTLPIRTFISYILKAFPFLDSIIPDWIKSIIRGKTFTVPGSGPAIGDQRVAAAAGASSPMTQESKVSVDFQNVPRGVNVERERGGDAPVDLSVGYAMAGG